MARLMGPTMSSISTSESRKVDPFFFLGGAGGGGLGLITVCGIVLRTMGLSLLSSVYSRSTK